METRRVRKGLVCSPKGGGEAEKLCDAAYSYIYVEENAGLWEKTRGRQRVLVSANGIMTSSPTGSHALQP
jgi:hypothetical protein